VLSDKTLLGGQYSF